MGYWSTLSEALRHPSLIGRRLNRFYYEMKGRDDPPPTNIIEEDWDNLIILDGCRYDMFEAKNHIQGDLEARVSLGSNTVEFLKKNLSNRDLLDTIYITANPQFHRHYEEIDATFHNVFDVWQEEGWDDEYSTVLPETITKRVLALKNSYPEKRFLVHYIQPHYPFISNEVDGFENDQAFLKSDEIGCWEQISRGELFIPPTEIWSAYNANLEVVLPHAAQLVEELEGRTVVTSDHGNMVGERAFPIPVKEWGHMSGLYTKELVTVPWLVCDDGERKTVVEDPPEPYKEGNVSHETEARLEDLGYL